MFKELKLTPPELVAKILSGVDIYSEASSSSDSLSLDENGQIRWVEDGDLLAISNALKNTWYIKVDWRETLTEKPVLCWVLNSGDNNFNNAALISDYDKRTETPFTVETNKGVDKYHYKKATPINSDDLYDYIGVTL